jgi:hypothetical protein
MRQFRISVVSLLLAVTGAGALTITSPAFHAAADTRLAASEPMASPAAEESPTITSAASTTAGVRSYFAFEVTTTGDPVPTLTETGALPSGVSFSDDDDGTTELQGILAVGSVGVYPVTITATNGVGSPASQVFTLTVTATASAPGIIVGRPPAAAISGEAFSRTIETYGYPVPKITKTGALPSGLTFTDNGDGTATVAGTPGKSASGPYYLILTATNPSGTATGELVLFIDTAPVIKKIPDTTGSVGDPLGLTITTSGFSPPALTESGTLPDGATFTDNGDGTAALAGTPAAGSGGVYPIAVTATNFAGTDSQVFALTIDELPMITSTGTASITIGMPFTFTVTAGGYPAPTITTSGTLPKGITFDKGTATFSGTAQAGTAGTYTILITSKNSSGKTAQPLTLTVAAAGPER